MKLAGLRAVKVNSEKSEDLESFKLVRKIIEKACLNDNE